MKARVLAAVQNNAHWCDRVCRSQGLPTIFSEQLWVAPEPLEFARAAGFEPLGPLRVWLKPGD